MVNSDMNRIRQIVLNFLSNSLKFTEKGSISLIAKMDKEKKGNILIGVKDTGLGMNQASIDKIFNAFNKIDLGGD